MAQDKNETWERLNGLWKSPDIESLPLAGAKYVVISDLHLGNGSKADDFRTNAQILLHALSEYKKDEFSLILLGDIEELWQFNMRKIYSGYKDIYDKIESFGKDHIYRIFGNHDLAWKRPKGKKIRELSKNQKAREAVKLADKDGNHKIILLHGHQGDRLSNRWYSRIFVRAYALIEPVIKVDPRPKSVRSQITKDYESIYYSWAKQNKAVVICGHTHRAIFASKSRIQRLEDEIAELKAKIKSDFSNTEIVRSAIRKISRIQNLILNEKQKGRDIDDTDELEEPLPCYFNDGCGVYSDGITVIEITGQKIKLVKWTMLPGMPAGKTDYCEEEWKTIFEKVSAVKSS